MSFIKKYSSAIVGVLVFVLVFIGFMLAKSIFFPAENKAIYGSRINDRDKFEISTETMNNVEAKLDSGVSSVDVRVAGRIIYIDVEVEESTSKEAAKELGGKALEAFSDKEKSYYDIQLLINNKSNKEQFPIIGYKHHTKSTFSWTKDR